MESRESLAAIRADLGDCQRCKLSQTRKNIVFGEGNPDADLMFVGQSAGSEEDSSGSPFVGASGKLLSELITKMGWRREDVYIANVVKCHPPGNRPNEKDEEDACLPFLWRQIKSVKPSVIVTLGKSAANAVLKNKEPIGKVRGKCFDNGDVVVIPTYHPSYILRGNYAELETMREDFIMAMIVLMSKGVLPRNWNLNG